MSLWFEITIAILGTIYILNELFRSCLMVASIPNEPEPIPQSVAHMYS